MNAPRRLPAELVDDVMRRLIATYGRRFLAQWEGVDPKDVKAIWARELAGYETRPDVFAWVFENLPEDPMNAIEFRNLCRRAPAKPVEELPAPPADPAKVAAVISEARQLLNDRPVADSRAWAIKVIERAAAGEPVSPGVLRDARAVARSIPDPA